ncbi:MAG: GAF domain-containing protein, partial [Anaerolineales bacterium]|nr:GAF domain-containing protein [Anaerolineales bacterium]
DQHPVVQNADERRARGESDQYELELLHRDGSRRSVIVAASPRYENDAWAGALVVFTDITERKRAETALRASEASYRGLFNSVAEAIYIQDRDGRFLDVNQGAVEMYGYPREFFIGETPEIVSAPDKNDLPAVQTQVARAFAGEPQRFEFWGKRSTGEIFPKDVRLYPGTYLGQPVVIALAADITERKRAEQALRDSETLYHRAIEAAGAVPYFHDYRLGIYSFMGEGIRQMTGYAPSEITPPIWASLVLDLIPVGECAELEHPELVRRARASEIPIWQADVQIRTRDGQMRWVNDSAVEIFDAQGIRQGSIGILQDITERKRVEQELRQRAAEFAALYETAQDLTRQTDLSTLLKTIIAHATMLLHTTSGAIFLYDPNRNQVELVVEQNFPRVPPLQLKMGEGMAGHVAQTRQPLIVDDYITWEHRSPKVEGIPFRASLDVPMIFGGELIGVLDMSEIGDSTRKFTEDDARLLSLFAAQAASAVYNARLLQQTQQRAEQLALLYDAVLTLNRAIEPHQVIEHLLEIANQSVHAERADFFRYDPDTRTLTFESGGGYAERLFPTLRTLQFAVGEPRGLVGLVAAEQTPLYLPDTSADPRWIPIDPAIRSALWIPVEREQHLFGVLAVTSTRADAFSPADQRLVALFANHVAVALERANLFQAERNHRAELAALYDLSRALADNDALDSICQLVVQHAVTAIPITFARLALIEGDALVVHAAQPIRVLDRDLRIGDRVALANLPCCQNALKQNQPTLQSVAAALLGADERAFVLFDLAKTVCFVPLRAGGQPLGLLMLGEMREPERQPFTPEALHHARSIGDQAASAIRRAKLREQTEQRLHQVQALHAIDTTINASLDLNVTLNVVVPQIATQLGADAVDILRYNPTTQMLTHLANQGFHSKAIEQTQLRLGKEYAGRAALERTLIAESNLPEHSPALLRRFLIADEKFVACVCTPLIAKGQIKGVLEVFFRAPFDPTPDWMEALQALSAQAALALDNAELFSNLQRSHLELTLAYEAIIEGWSRTIELHDPSTSGHAKRTAELTLDLGRALGVAEADLRRMRYGALLHNIGKLYIPDAIWRKRDALSPEEHAIVRQHPQKAYEILSASASLRPLLDIPYCHHEHWDGSGFPRGLAGEQIPLAARVFAIAETWDNRIERTSESPKIAHENARAYLREQSGQRFDPRIVQVFLQIVGAPKDEETPSS